MILLAFKLFLMNKKCIDTFYFNAKDETSCGKNYSGILGAIYLVIFWPGHNDSTKPLLNNNWLLEAIRTKKDLYSDNIGRDEFAEFPDNIATLSLLGWTKDNGNNADSYTKNIITHSLKIPINSQKSSFSCKSQGEKKGKTFLSELNVVLKERSTQVSELFLGLIQTDLKLGVVFKDANGDYRVMADPDYEMDIETSDETGEGPTGNALASIKFSQVSKIPPIYYRGDIHYDSIDGLTVSLAERQDSIIHCIDGEEKTGKDTDNF